MFTIDLDDPDFGFNGTRDDWIKGVHYGVMSGHCQVKYFLDYWGCKKPTFINERSLAENTEDNKNFKCNSLLEDAQSCVTMNPWSKILRNNKELAEEILIGQLTQLADDYEIGENLE